jgi:hypothetical protein
MRLSTKIFEEGLVAGAEMLSGDRPDSPLAFHIYLFFAEGISLYKGIAKLWADDYVGEAFTLGRTMFEVLLQAQWLLSHPDKLENFTKYVPLNLTKLERKLGKGFTELGDLGKAAEIAAQQIKHEGQNWTGMSPQALAERLGGTFWFDYNNFNLWETEYTHSGTLSAHLKALDEMQAEVESKREELDLLYPSWVTFRLIQLAKLLDAANGHQMQGRIKTVEDAITDLVQKTLSPA